MTTSLVVLMRVALMCRIVDPRTTTVISANPLIPGHRHEQPTSRPSSSNRPPKPDSSRLKPARNKPLVPTIAGGLRATAVRAPDSTR